jgi:hypothetical protein
LQFNLYKNFDIVLPITVVRWPANGDRKKDRKGKEIFLDRLHERTNRHLCIKQKQKQRGSKTQSLVGTQDKKEKERLREGERKKDRNKDYKKGLKCLAEKQIQT